MANLMLLNLVPRQLSATNPCPPWIVNSDVVKYADLPSTVDEDKMLTRASVSTPMTRYQYSPHEANVTVKSIRKKTNGVVQFKQAIVDQSTDEESIEHCYFRINNTNETSVDRHIFLLVQ